MTNTIRTIPDLIDLWSTTPIGRAKGWSIAFAADVGVLPDAVRQMRVRGSISKKYWAKIIESARKHASDSTTSPAFAEVSADLLVALAIVASPASSRNDSKPSKSIAA